MKNVCIAITAVIIFFTGCSKEDTPTPTTNTPPPVSSSSYSKDEITAFEELALLSTQNIIKLPKQVFYYVSDTTSQLYLQTIDAAIAEINSLTNTNLVIKRTNDSTLALAKIYYSDTTHFFAAAPQAIQFFHSVSYLLAGLNYMDWDGSNIIYRNAIYMDKDSCEKDSNAMKFIVYHELMHSVGLLGHIDIDHFGSIMFKYNIQPYVMDYTSFDKRMIQLLYNPAITPGMNKQQFESVIAKL